MTTPLRKRLSPTHPVLHGVRILADDEILRCDDLTTCVSTLLSLDGDRWVRVSEADDSLVGKTVAYACDEEYGDMDRNERVYVRIR